MAVDNDKVVCEVELNVLKAIVGLTRAAINDLTAKKPKKAKAIEKLEGVLFFLVDDEDTLVQ